MMQRQLHLQSSLLPGWQPTKGGYLQFVAQPAGSSTHQRESYSSDSGGLSLFQAAQLVFRFFQAILAYNTFKFVHLVSVSSGQLVLSQSLCSLSVLRRTLSSLYCSYTLGQGANEFSQFEELLEAILSCLLSGLMELP